MKLTIDRHESSRGFFATAKLLAVKIWDFLAHWGTPKGESLCPGPIYRQAKFHADRGPTTVIETSVTGQIQRQIIFVYKMIAADIISGKTHTITLVDNSLSN